MRVSSYKGWWPRKLAVRTRFRGQTCGRKCGKRVIIFKKSGSSVNECGMPVIIFKNSGTRVIIPINNVDVPPAHTCNKLHHFELSFQQYSGLHLLMLHSLSHSTSNSTSFA